MFQFHREHGDKPWDFGDTLFFRAKPMEIMFPMDFEPDSLDIVFRLGVFECVGPKLVPSFLPKMEDL